MNEQVIPATIFQRPNTLSPQGETSSENTILHFRDHPVPPGVTQVHRTYYCIERSVYFHIYTKVI